MSLLPKSATSFARLLRKSFFRLLFVCRIHVLLRSLKSADTITVLCFHRINDSIDLAWPSINRHVFENIIHYLQKQYHIISFHQLDQASTYTSKKPLLIISFDDGYLDFKENALPVLTKYGIPSNMNVITNCLENGDLIWTQRVNIILNYLFVEGKSFNFPIRDSFVLIHPLKDNIQKIKRTLQKELFNYPYHRIITILNQVEKELSITHPHHLMMSWQDLEECTKHHTTIGSQTITHQALHKESNENILEQEIVVSKQIIEKNIKMPVDIFAFPNGLKNDLAVAMAKKAGYKFLLEVSENYYHLSEHSLNTSAVKCIPRISIYHNDIYESIMNIEGFHIFVRKLKKLLF